MIAGFYIIKYDKKLDQINTYLIGVEFKVVDAWGQPPVFEMLAIFSVLVVGVFDFGEFNPDPEFDVRLQLINSINDWPLVNS